MECSKLPHVASTKKKSQQIILMDKLILQIIWTQVGFSESSQC